LATRTDAFSFEQKVLAVISFTGYNASANRRSGPTHTLASAVEDIRNNNCTMAMPKDDIERMNHSPKKRHAAPNPPKKRSESTAGLNNQPSPYSTHNDSPQSNLSISPTELNRLEVAARTNTEREMELAKVRAELDSLVHYSRSIQNEVERNYLEAQEQKTVNAALRKKIDCMTRNYSDIVFFESIKQIESEPLRWQIEGMETEDGRIDTLDLELNTLDAKPRLLISLSPHLGNPFSDSFSTSSPDKSSDGRLVITPNSIPGDTGYLTLRMLSGNELRTLDNALYLANRFLVKNPLNPQAELIANVRKTLKELPRTLRFHNAKIDGSAPLPAYESLQFSLRDARYGDRKWNTFTFKLAATRSTGMLTQPRLEFHMFDANNRPFENWFVESSDGLGDRLELRFDTNTEAFDSAVWKRLSEVDQMQLLSIISKLPLLLELVPIHGEGKSLDVSSWKVLALSMHKILYKHGLPANTLAVV